MLKHFSFLSLFFLFTKYFFCFQNEWLPSLSFDTLVNHWTTMLIQNKFLYMTTSSNKLMELILFYLMFQIISSNFSVWFQKTSQFDYVILTINTHMFHQSSYRLLRDLFRLAKEVKASLLGRLASIKERVVITNFFSWSVEPHDFLKRSQVQCGNNLWTEHDCCI